MNLSDEEYTKEEDIAEVNGKEKVKPKGVRRRFGSWRSKKQRSASESDMAVCDLERAFQQDKELSEAWFGIQNLEKHSTNKLKKHHSTASRKYSSPAHLPVTRGNTIAGE